MNLQRSLSSSGDGTGGYACLFRFSAASLSLLKDSSSSCNIFPLRAESFCFTAATYSSSAGGLRYKRFVRESASLDANSSRSFIVFDALLLLGSSVQLMVSRRFRSLSFATVLSFLYPSKLLLPSISL